MESERLAVPSLSPCIAGLKLLTLGLVALVVAIVTMVVGVAANVLVETTERKGKEKND